MTKRFAEKTPEEKESEKKQKMLDDEIEGVDSFEVATVRRNFRLVVEGRSVFVNPHSLAEFSTFFETLCLGSFAEASNGEAELKEEKYDDVIEMFNVMGLNPHNIPKEIDCTNFVAMMTLADKWQIRGLWRRCLVFIESQLPNVMTTFSDTMKVLILCERNRVPRTALLKVASRLAAFGKDLLIEQKIWRVVTDSSLFLAILHASESNECDDVMMHEHTNCECWLCTDQKCFVPNCDLKGPLCTHCDTAVCKIHKFCSERVSTFKTDTNKDVLKAELETGYMPQLY